MYAPFVCIDINRSLFEKHQVSCLNLKDISTHIKLKDNLKQTKSKGLMYFDILIKNHKDLASLNQILINCSISNYVVIRKLLFMIFSFYKCKTYKKAIKYSKMIKSNKNAVPTEIEGKSKDVVCTMHSGGTSGVPKIIELQNCAFNDLSISLEKMYTRKIRGGGNEYSLVALPIFHAYGLGVSVHTCLTNQYSLVLVPNFKPKTFNKIIKKYNVTFFAGVPIMFKKMMEQKNFRGRHLAKLRDLWCGGDVLTEPFVEHFDIILKKYKSSARLFRGYGLTEVSSVCAANTFENYRPYSCGKAIPNTKIEIWDDNNNLLAPNTIGEIAVCSPSVMKGYLNEVNFNDDSSNIITKDIIIKEINTAIIDGNTYYYLTDSENNRYRVSIKVNSLSFQEVSAYTLSLVTPGVSSTIEIL